MLNNQCCEGLRRREEVRGTLRETGLFLGESMLLGLKTRSDIAKLYRVTFKSIFQGIVFHHREDVWGDHCNSTLLLEAVRRLSKQQ